MTDGAAKPPSHSTTAKTMLRNAPWLSAPQTQTVFSTLNTAKHVSRAVGGAIRNTLMGRPASDIDIATTATPEQVIELATSKGLSAHPTGIDHGTVTLVCDHRTFEVTTLRTDLATDGRRATIKFTNDWTLDAKRRDFTINALYCDADGTLYDPLDGLADLRKGRIRFIGDPHARIREDYLRILRFFRFFATYSNGQIDSDGLEACIKLAPGIKTLSGERIQAELLRLLDAERVLDALSVMNESNLLELTLGSKPDINQLGRLKQIEDTAQRTPDPLLRLAALAVSTSQDATNLKRHLKLSNAQSNRLKRLAGKTSDEVELANNSDAQRNARANLYRLGRQSYTDTVLLDWAQSDNPIDDPAREERLRLPEHWTPPSMPFGGTDVTAFGVPPGPQVGRILSQFETWWITNDFPNAPETLKTKLEQLVRVTKL